MVLLNSNFVLNEEKKDEKGTYVYKTLARQEKKPRKEIPWINQPQLDGGVQVL